MGEVSLSLRSHKATERGEVEKIAFHGSPPFHGVMYEVVQD